MDEKKTLEDLERVLMRDGLLEPGQIIVGFKRDENGNWLLLTDDEENPAGWTLGVTGLGELGESTQLG